ncbi:MAG: hypothetical protein Q4A18_04880 [Rikenellaceae bacterium]|nr:hypothetical protein [Rikenellaceae bacterium]
MNYLESPKQYTGIDVEKIFFRPILTGDGAKELGIRVLYNMPVPTVVQLWDGSRNVLKKFTTNGWTGGDAATKYQKQIPMERVKAELGFSAADYFSLVYEQISARADINMEDLTGTILEQAETELFKQAIAENLRMTMWLGDTSRNTGYNTFNGFLTSINQAVTDDVINYTNYAAAEMTAPEHAVAVLQKLWDMADPALKSMRGEGQLAFFCTSDICDLYEQYLDSMGVESSFRATTEGVSSLAFHGIPIVDPCITNMLAQTSLHQSFALLTDRRNLVMAVNTADIPGNEVRMWYNPDEMENRQRALFMAGCEILDENMLSYAYRS